jgi:hypothetical protein
MLYTGVLLNEPPLAVVMNLRLVVENFMKVSRRL